MVNRLGDATSPYLLQHKDNPVDWWPWSPAAFDEARRRDVPVLLSVGYAACHWCHVMAHESFEDDATAALMNELFVCVKVDREERPDVDAVYMEATQAMTGHGGWPMTCFLTPTGEPFFCGTYFPREQLRELLVRVAQVWRNQRDDVVEQAARILESLSQYMQPPAPSALTSDVLDAAVVSLASSYDEVRGGFGGAPKFPPSMCLEFLLRNNARTGDERALRMVDETCRAMAHGGIYDQLGGGFARYSVDAHWTVPHFEKMLYDNALLMRVYAHWWRQTDAAAGHRVAVETGEFLLRELRTTQGGLASSLDADSEGEEGKFYVFGADELGPDAMAIFDVPPEGSFEHGKSVLRLARHNRLDEDYQRERTRLFALREQRVRPGRDDKVVASWNGLAIAALAEGGALFDRTDFVGAAVEAARLIRDVHVVDGRLRRTSRDGRVGENSGVLDDYGNVADGFLQLYSVTGDAAWLHLAGELLDVTLDHFRAEDGGFYDTADDAEQLVRRPRDVTDNATPSGTSAVAGALLSYAAYTGSARHRDAAAAALGSPAGLAAEHARFVGWAAAVGEALLAGPLEIAVVGADDPDRQALEHVARRSSAPGAVLAVGAPQDGAADVALLSHRTLRDGRATAYVCRNFACEAPVTDPGSLARLL